MNQPDDSSDLSALRSEELIERELEIRREKAQRHRTTLNKTDEWYHTVATRGHYRIFWIDTYDSERGRYSVFTDDSDLSCKEWESMDDAKAAIAERRKKEPNSSCNYFIFDDIGRQIWLDSCK